MTSAAEFQAKVEKADVNMGRLDQIVNGGPTTEVVVDGGTVPSIAKLMADTEAASAAAGAADALQSAEDAATSAGNAATSAGNAATQAGIASDAAGVAGAQAGIATTQATIATAQAGVATTQSGIAAIQATAAAAAAAVSGRPYPSIFSAQLPQGISTIAIGGTAITGATPGTYPLTFTGGDYVGMSASLVVDTATSARIVFDTMPDGRPAYGVNIGGGTTLPTVTKPSGANLPAGTTLTAVAGTLIAAETQTYWVQSSDGTQLQLYGNHSGAATPAGSGSGGTFFGGSQLAVPVGTNIAAVLSALLQSLCSTVQTIGRTATPTSGTVATGAAFLWGNPAGQASILGSIAFVARATGTFKLARYTKSGTTYTLAATYTAAVTSTGLQSLTAASFGMPMIPVNASDYLEISGGSMFDYTSNTADGAGWSLQSSFGAATISNPSFSTSTRLEVQINLAQQQVTAATAQQVAAAATKDSLSAVTQIIGRPVTPVTGTAASASGLLLGDAIAASGTIGSIQVYCLTPGTFQVQRYTKSGTTYSPGPVYTTTLVSGLNTLTPASFGQSSIAVAAGEYLMVSGNSVWGYTSNTADGAGWASGTFGATISNPSFNSSLRLELQINLNTQNVTGTAFAALQSTVNSLNTTVSANALAVGNLSTSNTQVIGKPSNPVTGTAVGTAGFLLADPVLNAGTLTSLKLFALGTGTFTLKFYTKSGTTYTQVATYSATISSTGLNTLTPASFGQSSIPVLAGYYVGVSGNTGASWSYNAGTADGSGWAAATGTTISNPSFLTGSGRLELQINLAYSVQTVTAATFAALQASVAAGAAPMAGCLNTGTTIGQFDWNGLTAYGQSNSLGHNATPLLDTTASVRHKMAAVGVVMTKPGISGGTNADNGSAAAMQNLTGITDPGGGTNGAGESSLVWAAKLSTPQIAADRGAAPTFFVSAAGYSGAAIATIGYNTAWYANLRYHWLTGYNRANSAGKTYAATFVCMDHGEADSLAGTTQTTYQAAITALITGSAADRLADYGQTQTTHWLFTTPCYGIATSSGTAMAIMALCEPVAEGGRPDCHFVAPNYIFPVQGDNIHLTAAGQGLKGAYQARAKAQIFAGKRPDRLRWLGVVAQGTTLTAYVAGPTACAFTTTNVVGAATNQGIKVVDDTGTLTLSSIACGTAVWNAGLGAYVTPVTMTLNRTLGTNPMFRYALDYLGAGMAVNSGASGNLFDATTTTITINGTVYSMAHAAPPVAKAVAVID